MGMICFYTRRDYVSTSAVWHIEIKGTLRNPKNLYWNHYDDSIKHCQLNQYNKNTINLWDRRFYEKMNIHIQYMSKYIDYRLKIAVWLAKTF